jgi:hypothetical protein
MAVVASDFRGRWWAAGAVAGLITATFVLVIRLPVAPPAVRSPEAPATVPPTVRIARPDASDRLLQEEADLRDLRPMFLPTERNAALVEPRMEAGRNFLDHESFKAAAEPELGAVLPEIGSIQGGALENATPLDAMGATGIGLPLAGFGRQSPEVVPMRPRGAVVEAVAMSDGRTVWIETLPEGGTPRRDLAWTPLEMVAVVDRAGLAGPLVITEGSRVDDVDIHFRNYLAQTFRLGERLAPGFYRIIVSP